MERILKEKDKHGKDIIVYMIYVSYKCLKRRKQLLKCFLQNMHGIKYQIPNCILILKHINFLEFIKLILYFI